LENNRSENFSMIMTWYVKDSKLGTDRVAGIEDKELDLALLKELPMPSTETKQLHYGELDV
jgi:hypothetical protein